MGATFPHCALQCGTLLLLSTFTPNCALQCGMLLLYFVVPLWTLQLPVWSVSRLQAGSLDNHSLIPGKSHWTSFIVLIFIFACVHWFYFSSAGIAYILVSWFVVCWQRSIIERDLTLAWVAFLFSTSYLQLKLNVNRRCVQQYILTEHICIYMHISTTKQNSLVTEYMYNKALYLNRRFVQQSNIF